MSEPLFCTVNQRQANGWHNHVPELDFSHSLARAGPLAWQGQSGVGRQSGAPWQGKDGFSEQREGTLGCRRGPWVARTASPEEGLAVRRIHSSSDKQEGGYGEEGCLVPVGDYRQIDYVAVATTVVVPRASCVPPEPMMASLGTNQQPGPRLSAVTWKVMVTTTAGSHIANTHDEGIGPGESTLGS